MSTNSTTKRRGFRFSVKAMLIAVAVLSIGFGMLVHRVQKRRDMIAWIVSKRGCVSYKWTPRFENMMRFYEQAERDALGQISPLQRALGDQGVIFFELPIEEFGDKDQQHIRELFPEAKLERTITEFHGHGFWTGGVTGISGP